MRAAATADRPAQGSGRGTVPAVSVIVPTHDRAAVVGRAIGTVLDQTFRELEVVLVDDGSSDGTREVVAAIDDPRVVYVRQDRSGVSVARNRGVAASGGPIVAFLDSDDEVRPRWLASLMAAMADERVGIATCAAATLGEDDAITGFRTSRNAGLPNDPSMVFLAGTFAVRREVFDAAGGYVTGLKHSENTELGLRLVDLCRARGWRVVTADDPLLMVHVANTRREYSSARLDAIRYMLDRHRSTLASEPRVLADYLGVGGVCAVRMGSYDQARRWFLDAVRANPRGQKAYGRLLLSLWPRAAERVWGRVASPDGAGAS